MNRHKLELFVLYTLTSAGIIGSFITCILLVQNTSSFSTIISLIECIGFLLMLIGGFVFQFTYQDYKFATKFWALFAFSQFWFIIFEFILNGSPSTTLQNQLILFVMITLGGSAGVSFKMFCLACMNDYEQNPIIIDIPDIEGDATDAKDCSICLESIVKDGCQIQKCQHTFHKRCIGEWIVLHANTCPMCRQAVV